VVSASHRHITGGSVMLDLTETYGKKTPIVLCATKRITSHASLAFGMNQSTP
jgi:hypothetical protein